MGGLIRGRSDGACAQRIGVRERARSGWWWWGGGRGRDQTLGLGRAGGVWDWPEGKRVRNIRELAEREKVEEERRREMGEEGREEREKLDGMELDWIGLDWIGLDWTGLDARGRRGEPGLDASFCSAQFLTRCPAGLWGWWRYGTVLYCTLLYCTYSVRVQLRGR